MLFNPTTVVIEHFIEELVDHYVKMHGQNESDTQLVVANARNALEIIANSDAPYHDVNHTTMVTMVGMEILRGKILIEGSVSAKSWAHFVVSLLHHDIGYVRGICRADRSGRYAINKDMDTVTRLWALPMRSCRLNKWIVQKSIFGNDSQMTSGSISIHSSPISNGHAFPYPAMTTTRAAWISAV